MPAYWPNQAHLLIEIMTKIFGRIILFHHQVMSLKPVQHIVTVFLNDYFAFTEIQRVGMIRQGGRIWTGNNVTSKISICPFWQEL